MTRSYRTLILAILLCAVAVLGAACSDESEYVEPNASCFNGEVVDFEGDSYCILIEEGFLVKDCPEEFPNGRDFDGVIACGEDKVPDALKEELEERGILKEEGQGENNNSSNGNNSSANNPSNNNETDICLELEEEIGSVYQEFSSCETNSDCVIVDALSGCNAVINSEGAEAYSELVSRIQEARCGFADCAPVDRAACQEGRCIGEWGDEPIGICEDLESRYQNEVEINSACEVDADCKVVPGQCGAGLGGCYEFVNQDFDAGRLSELGSEFWDAECTDAVCDCDDPPEVSCNSGTCGPREEQPGDGACGSSSDCAEDQFCWFSQKICGADNTPGECRPRPTNCEGAPTEGVCPCEPIEGDQALPYWSECAANMAGSDVSSFGGCWIDGPGSSFDCGDMLTCSPGDVCNISFNDVFGPDEPEYFANCSAPPPSCDGQQTSCDCLDLEEWDTCNDSTGETMVFYPGG